MPDRSWEFAPDHLGPSASRPPYHFAHLSAISSAFCTATAKVIKVAGSQLQEPKSRQNGNNNETLFKNFWNVAQICARMQENMLGPMQT